MTPPAWTHPVRRRPSATLLLLIATLSLAAACGPAANTSSGSSASSSARSSSPGMASSAAASQTSELPSAGECVETDQRIGALTTLRVFRATSCLSPLASYRVVAVMPVGLSCPAEATAQVDRASQRFCLGDVSPAAESSPAIDLTVVAKDCVHLERDTVVTVFTKAACDDPAATDRVLAVFDSIIPECPKGSDDRVTLIAPLSSGGGMFVACLATLGR